MCQIVCAWCTRFLRGDPTAGLVSHGICPECAGRMLEEHRKAEVEQRLDWLENQEIGGEG